MSGALQPQDAVAHNLEDARAALDAARLAISDDLPPEQFAILKTAEASEKAWMPAAERAGGGIDRSQPRSPPRDRSIG